MHVKTFKKYTFQSEFEVLDKNDDGYITKLRCKICHKNIAQIREEARRRGIKGAVLNSVMSYADGVDYIHKNNLVRHIKSKGLHDWAKQHCTEESDASSSDANTPKKKTVEGTVPIDQLITQNTKVGYQHLFRTALYIAMEERPFADFAGK